MFWRRNGKLITRNGKLIRCDNCPCFCSECRDIEKDYQEGRRHYDSFRKEYQYITEYRDSDYEVFTEYYEQSDEIRYNGQKGIDWGVITFNYSYYPLETPDVTIIDARNMSKKYGRKGCYYRYNPWGPFGSKCIWYGKYIYPDCKTMKYVGGYKNYKKFDVTVCVNDSADVDFYQYNFILRSDYTASSCGNKIILDGIEYEADKFFEYPGYFLCEEEFILIKDNYDHAGNNYHHEGTHTYNLVFYLPVAYEEDSSSSIQEDDIQ